MEGHTRTEDHDILSAMEKYMQGYSSESISREILRCVQEPNVKVISVVWDYEFGNSRNAKFVGEEAMKSKQYGVAIWIDPVRDSSARKLQMRIADKLGVKLSWVKKERDAAAATSEGEEEEEEEEDEQVVQKRGALDIFRVLLNRQLKLLLVVDFVRNDSLEWGEMGFLYFLFGTKFIFMARGKTELHIPHFKVDRVIDVDSYMEIDDGGIRFLASEMLVTGARDVAVL